MAMLILPEVFSLNSDPVYPVIFENRRGYIPLSNRKKKLRNIVEIIFLTEGNDLPYHISR